MKKSVPIGLSLLFLLLVSIAEQGWKNHQQTIHSKLSLILCNLFDGSSVLANEPDSPMVPADVLMQKLIPSDLINPLTVASSAEYREILDNPKFLLQNRQRVAVEKCYAQALFAEGKTEEAKKLLDGLYERERTFNSEDLAKQNLSAEFTKLYEKHCSAAAIEPPKRAEAVVGIVVPALPHGKTTRQLFVAPNGKADNPGTVDEPFGSLTQARDAIRKMRAEEDFDANCLIEVIVRGGVYPVTETFVLERQDSGNIFHHTRDIIEEIPIVYRAASGETPVFTGGVPAANFQKVDDSNVLKRLPKESQGKVLVAQIAKDVVFPPAAPRGYGKNGLGAAPNVELFVDDKPQQIARYPNAPKPGAADALKESEKTFMKTGKVHRSFFETDTANQPGIFEYSDERHERWTEAKDAMLFGYWGHLWGITSCLVEKIDPQTKQVVLATNNPYGHRENMPYYAFNLLEEIDEPGEWYLDRETNKVYIYPPQGVELNAAKVRLSCFPKEFIKAADINHVTFCGLHFEEGTGTAIRITGGDNVNIVGCSIKRFGNWGLGLAGRNNRVIGCDFVTLGGGGIELNGGDVETLTPGNCFVENTFVNDFSRIDRCYAPAVAIGGVGNSLRYNLFCDSPGHAIRVEGMEQTIEFNEIHSIVYESDDQAGIDIWGNPFIRGMVFRYNYWHHIGSGRNVAGQSGIRLDDMISSVLIYGNIFYRASGGQFGGVQIHGGKDNVVDGNLMIDCKYAVSFSPWGEKRWLEQLDGSFGTRSRRSGFNPDSSFYKGKYSDYADLKLNADRNLITRNAAIGCDEFANHGQRNVFSGNVMLPWLPELFKERKDSARLSIPMDSPIYELLGIVPIPEESMGLYRDNEMRKEIPQPSITPFFVLE